MPEAVPTVTIVNPDKPEEQLVMNQSEYDPQQHVLWEERDTKPLPKPTPPASPSASSGGRAAGSPSPDTASEGGKHQDTTPPSKAVYPDASEKGRK